MKANPTKIGLNMKTKPTSYHWYVYATNGDTITTCEYKGGRDKVKRTRREQARWPDFGAFSRIIAGEYHPHAT